MRESGKSLEEHIADLAIYVQMREDLIDYQFQMMDLRYNLDTLRKDNYEDIEDLIERAESLREQLMRVYEARDADIMFADAHCDTQWAAKRLECLRESTGFGVIYKSLNYINESLNTVDIRITWCGELCQDLINKIDDLRWILS